MSSPTRARAAAAASSKTDTAANPLPATAHSLKAATEEEATLLNIQTMANNSSPTAAHKAVLLKCTLHGVASGTTATAAGSTSTNKLGSALLSILSPVPKAHKEATMDPQVTHPHQPNTNNNNNPPTTHLQSSNKPQHLQKRTIISCTPRVD